MISIFFNSLHKSYRHMYIQTVETAHTKSVLQPGFEKDRVLKRESHFKPRFSKIGRVWVSFITVW